MSKSFGYIAEIFRILNNRKKIIFSVSLILSVVVGVITYRTKEQFATYSKIFPLSFSKSSSSPVDAIKAQFGISDKTDYSVIYNISVLVKSKLLSTNVVKNKSTNPKYNTIADWLIAEFNNHAGPLTKKIKIPLEDTNSIYLAGASLLVSSVEVVTDKTEFTKVTTKAYNKKLSKLLNECILRELSDYYILVSTEKPRTDLFKLGLIRDSLKNEMDAIESAIAGFQDANQLSVKYSTNIPQAKLLRARAEIEQLYSTTATAYHNARFKLLSESPIFQILDRPGEPYETIKPSWKKFSFVAFCISAFFLSLIFVWKTIMRMLFDELATP